MKYTFTNSNTYVDLNTELGIPTGTSVSITNNTTANVYVVKGLVIPAIEGQVIPPNATVRVQQANGYKVWVKGSVGSIFVQTQHQADAPFTLADLPSSRYTSDMEGFSRLQVDVGQTGFFEGREFRVVRKLTVAAGTPLTWKFTSAHDFILFQQHMDASEGDLEFYAWRSDNVTENTPFNTAIPILGKNISSEYRDFGSGRYVSGVSINAGGTITILNSNNYADYDRAKVSGATGQQFSIPGTDNTSRYLAAGTYYLQFTSLSGTSVGRFILAWEERQSD